MTRVPYLAFLAAILLLSACSTRGGTDAVQPAADRAGMPGDGGHDHGGHQHAGHDTDTSHGPPGAHVPRGDAGHAHTLPATAGPGYTVADVRFMQDMIGHHEQALVMAELASRNGAGELVLRLAEKIEISQHDEIAMMKAWLVERGQGVPDAGHVHDMHMPGMVSPERLAQLEAARGRDFDRLFLILMIQHHEGALDMVDALFASPGAAQDSDIFRFATDVASDQADEIGVMQTMLELLATTRSESR